MTGDRSVDSESILPKGTVQICDGHPFNKERHISGNCVAAVVLRELLPGSNNKPARIDCICKLHGNNCRSLEVISEIMIFSVFIKKYIRKEI
jgi:hypothetical protein